MNLEQPPTIDNLELEKEKEIKDSIIERNYKALQEWIDQMHAKNDGADPDERIATNIEINIKIAEMIIKAAEVATGERKEELYFEAMFALNDVIVEARQNHKDDIVESIEERAAQIEGILASISQR